MNPVHLTNDELEREARNRDDPLLREAIRRLIGGEYDEDEDNFEIELAAAESRAEEAEGETETLATLCAETADTLRQDDPKKWADLIKKLEDA